MVSNYFYTLLNFFLYIVQYTNIFWRILAPMYMRDVGLQFSPLVMSLSSFETRVMLYISSVFLYFFYSDHILLFFQTFIKASF